MLMVTMDTTNVVFCYRMVIVTKQNEIGNDTIHTLLRFAADLF
jgi:hypothetical protein